MTCEQYQELIFKKIDNEITGEEESLLSEHLVQCDECRKLFASLSSLETVLLSIPEAKVPESFTDQVMQKVTQASEQKKRKHTRPYFSLIAACMVLVIALYYNAANGGIPLFNDKITERSSNEPSSALINELENSPLDSSANLSISADNSAGISYSASTAEPAQPSNSTGGASDKGSYVYVADTESYYPASLTKEAASPAASEENTWDAPYRGDVPRAGGSSDIGEDTDSAYADQTQAAVENIAAPVATTIDYGNEQLIRSVMQNSTVSYDTSELSATEETLASENLTSYSLHLSRSKPYTAIASVTVANEQLEELLSGLDYIRSGEFEYDFAIEEFEIFKERAAKNGISVSQSELRSDSNRVLLTMTVK